MAGLWITAQMLEPTKTDHERFRSCESRSVRHEKCRVVSSRCDPVLGLVQRTVQ
jgi:hypothetical protein